MIWLPDPETLQQLMEINPHLAQQLSPDNIGYASLVKVKRAKLRCWACGKFMSRDSTYMNYEGSMVHLSKSCLDKLYEVKLKNSSHAFDRHKGMKLYKEKAPFERDE